MTKQEIISFVEKAEKSRKRDQGEYFRECDDVIYFGSGLNLVFNDYDTQEYVDDGVAFKNPNIGVIYDVEYNDNKLGIFSYKGNTYFEYEKIYQLYDNGVAHFIINPKRPELKSIETEYRGIRFRSKLEAHWAVFFDECGVNWEYEPQCFDLGDGIWYLPDFVLHNVGNCRGADGNGDIWVEVKGKMTPKDYLKIDYWMYGDKKTREDNYQELLQFWNPIECDKEHPVMIRGILVLGEMPRNDRWDRFGPDSFERAANKQGEYYHMFYSFSTLDGDQWGCAPGIDSNGKFMLIQYEHGGDGEDWNKTENAYYIARNYRFDHRND